MYLVLHLSLWGILQSIRTSGKSISICGWSSLARYCSWLPAIRLWVSPSCWEWEMTQVANGISFSDHSQVFKTLLYYFDKSWDLYIRFPSYSPIADGSHLALMELKLEHTMVDVLQSLFHVNMKVPQFSALWEWEIMHNVLEKLFLTCQGAVYISIVGIR